MPELMADEMRMLKRCPGRQVLEVCRLFLGICKKNLFEEEREKKGHRVALRCVQSRWSYWWCRENDKRIFAGERLDHFAPRESDCMSRMSGFVARQAKCIQGVHGVDSSCTYGCMVTPR